MALTEAQKDANKAVRKIRDRLYHARYRDLRNAEDAAERAIKDQLSPQIEAAAAAHEAAEVERDAIMADIDRQIAELTERRKAKSAELGERTAALYRPLRALYDQQRHEIAAAKARIAAGYPDMDGCARWSAAAWGATDFAKAAVAAEMASISAGEATKP